MSGVAQNRQGAATRQRLVRAAEKLFAGRRPTGSPSATHGPSCPPTIRLASRWRPPRRRIHAIAEYVNRQQGIVDQWRTDNLGEFGQVIIGTPDDAIAQIERFIDKTGGFGTLLILHVDMANWEDTKRSYELFASEVVPHFKNRNAGRQASLQFAEDHREYLLGGLIGPITKAHNDYYGQPAEVAGA